MRAVIIPPTVLDFLLSTRSAVSIGANSTYSLAGHYFRYGLSADYGPAVRQFEVTANFRGVRDGHRPLGRRYDEFHTVRLPALPRLKFLAKKHRVTLEYETKVVDASFLDRYGFLSAEIFAKVAAELAAQLHLIDKKLTATGGFDLARFHRDVAVLVADVPASDGQLRELDKRLEAAEKQRYAAMDAWEKLDVDWDAFHPDARRLLHDPFFWDRIDDAAPHGNDTGADLLAEFRERDKTYPTAAAHELARRVLESWDIDAVTHPEIADEAIVAAAFAAIKLRGACDARTRDLALAALGRQMAERDAAWRAKLQLLVGALEQLP
jgi:uncharacterized protein YfeS